MEQHKYLFTMLFTLILIYLRKSNLPATLNQKPKLSNKNSEFSIINFTPSLYCICITTQGGIYNEKTVQVPRSYSTTCPDSSHNTDQIHLWNLNPLFSGKIGKNNFLYFSDSQAGPILEKRYPLWQSISKNSDSIKSFWVIYNELKCKEHKSFSYKTK